MSWSLKACRARTDAAVEAILALDDKLIAEARANALGDRAWLLRLLDLAEGYLQHSPGCPPAAGAACDCGLAELQKQLAG